MKKLGEKEWATLTEKERQRRIMQIKQKEKKLRRQGKYDDLAKLFQNLAITEQGKFWEINMYLLLMANFTSITFLLVVTTFLVNT